MRKVTNQLSQLIKDFQWSGDGARQEKFSCDTYVHDL